MTTNVAYGLTLERPTGGAFASVDLEDQQLCWNPWAPPVLLNGRAAAIRDALDGSDLTETAGLLAEMEKRPAHEVLSELRSVVRSLALHGLLQESPQWRRPEPAVVGHELTPCDLERIQLQRATVFDLDLGPRRITVSVADTELADRLKATLPFTVLPGTEPLHAAAHEFAIAPADRERGFHHLYGRGGRIYARSLERDDVVRSFIVHLWSLQWQDANATDLIWLDAFALTRKGAITLLPGHLRRLWQTMARRLTRAGHHLIESVQVGVDPNTGLLIPPPHPSAELLDVLDRMEIEHPLPSPVDALEPTRFEELVSPVDFEGLKAAGHDPDWPSLPLIAYRLALLGHRGTADTTQGPAPSLDRARTILASVADIAGAPQLTARIHSDPRVMLAALCS